MDKRSTHSPLGAALVRFSVFVACASTVIALPALSDAAHSAFGKSNRGTVMSVQDEATDLQSPPTVSGRIAARRITAVFANDPVLGGDTVIMASRSDGSPSATATR